jgi:hypothetical protein
MEVKFTVSGPATVQNPELISIQMILEKRRFTTLVQSGISIIEKLLWNGWRFKR